MLTQQEIFNQVWDWFVVQKKPKSVIPRTSNVAAKCLYRGPNGCKCAAGVVIPDEMYKPSMEGESISTVIQTSTSLKAYIGNENKVFLTILQEIHDNNSAYDSTFGEEMKKDLLYVAAKFSLNLPPGSVVDICADR